MSDLIDLPEQRSMPQTRALARQRHIETFATAPSAGHRFTRRTARFVTVLAGGAVLLVGGTAAATYVAFRPATVPVADQTRCYTKATLDGGDDFFGTTVTVAYAADAPRTPASALTTCADLWRQGLLHLGTKAVDAPDPGHEYPVPPLVACVLDSGVAAVFPGDDRTCALLGLSQLAE